MTGDIMTGVWGEMQDGCSGGTNKAGFGDIPGTGIIGEMQVGIMDTTLHGEIPAPVQCGIMEGGLYGEMPVPLHFGIMETGVIGDM